MNVIFSSSGLLVSMETPYDLIDVRVGRALGGEHQCNTSKHIASISPQGNHIERHSSHDAPAPPCGIEPDGFGTDACERICVGLGWKRAFVRTALQSRSAPAAMPGSGAMRPPSPLPLGILGEPVGILGEPPSPLLSPPHEPSVLRCRTRGHFG